MYRRNQKVNKKKLERKRKKKLWKTEGESARKTYSERDCWRGKQIEWLRLIEIHII